MIDRTPPQDLDAEQAVLGAMLLSKDARCDVLEVLTGPDFYRLAHEHVFRAICAQDESGEPVDPITVAGRLAQAGHLDQLGGPLYLHELVSSVTVAANARSWAHQVRDTAIRRSIIDRALQAQQLAYEGSLPAIDLAEQARGLFDETAAVRADYVSYGDMVDVVIDEMDHGVSRGVPTAWVDLDELITGWQPGRLYVIAARPAVGKSIAAQTLTTDLALYQHRDVLYVALEMSTRELTRRALAAAGQVNLTKLIRGAGELSEDEWAKLSKAVEKVRAQSVYINDDPVQTVATIRSQARSLSRRGRLGMVIVDHMGLVTPEDPRLPRTQQIGSITRGLKKLAKELHVPVVALSQLNRASESGHERRRPTLTDLRDSGDIEQDSDIVMFLHVPDPERNPTSVVGIVAKNRDGALGEVPLVRQGQFARLLPATHERNR